MSFLGARFVSSIPRATDAVTQTSVPPQAPISEGLRRLEGRLDDKRRFPSQEEPAAPTQMPQFMIFRMAGVWLKGIVRVYDPYLFRYTLVYRAHTAVAATAISFQLPSSTDAAELTSCEATALHPDETAGGVTAHFHYLVDRMALGRAQGNKLAARLTTLFRAHGRNWLSVLSVAAASTAFSSTSHDAARTDEHVWRQQFLDHPLVSDYITAHAHPGLLDLFPLKVLSTLPFAVRARLNLMLKRHGPELCFLDQFVAATRNSSSATAAAAPGDEKDPDVLASRGASLSRHLDVLKAPTAHTLLSLHGANEVGLRRAVLEGLGQSDTRRALEWVLYDLVVYDQDSSGNTAHGVQPHGPGRRIVWSSRRYTLEQRVAEWQRLFRLVYGQCLEVSVSGILVSHSDTLDRLLGKTLSLVESKETLYAAPWQLVRTHYWQMTVLPFVETLRARPSRSSSCGETKSTRKRARDVETTPVEEPACKRPRLLEPPVLIQPLVEEQTRALDAIHSGRHPVVVISGGAGSGKTHLLLHIRDALAHGTGMRPSSRAACDADDKKQQTVDSPRVLVLTPTRRIRKRLRVRGLYAMTIDKFLAEYRAYHHNGLKTPTLSRTNEAPSADFRTLCSQIHTLVVEETSMTDEAKVAALHEPIAADLPRLTQLVFLGDVNQLKSVGPGSVLRDISAAFPDSYHEFSHNHRVHKGSRVLFDLARALLSRTPARLPKELQIQSPTEARLFAEGCYRPNPHASRVLLSDSGLVAFSLEPYMDNDSLERIWSAHADLGPRNCQIVAWRRRTCLEINMFFMLKSGALDEDTYTRMLRREQYPKMVFCGEKVQMADSLTVDNHEIDNQQVFYVDCIYDATETQGAKMFPQEHTMAALSAGCVRYVVFRDPEDDTTVTLRWTQDLRQACRPGWCVTTHAMQGDEAPYVFGILEAGVHSDWLYSMCTRAKLGLHVFVRGPDRRKKLVEESAPPHVSLEESVHLFHVALRNMDEERTTALHAGFLATTSS